MTPALECVVADSSYDQVRAVNVTPETLDAPALNIRLNQEAEPACAIMHAADLPIDRIDVG